MNHKVTFKANVNVIDMLNENFIYNNIYTREYNDNEYEIIKEFVNSNMLIILSENTEPENIDSIGNVNDNPMIDTSLSGTEISILKGILKHLQNGNINTYGNLITQLTNQNINANTNILSTNYIATNYQNSTLMIMTDTSAILNLVVNDQIGALNSGVMLNANQWYSFNIPLMSEVTYNLQLSVAGKVQINWLNGI